MTDITTEQIVEAGVEQVEAHALGETWGDDGVGFVGCDCGQWFGKALEGGWSRATQHVVQAAHDAMLPLIRKQLADEVRRQCFTPEGAKSAIRQGRSVGEIQAFDETLEYAARLIEGVDS